MVTMNEACRRVLSTCKEKQIFQVNEYDTAYECLLINWDENPSDLRRIHGILPAIVCEKADGKIIENLFMGEWGGFEKEPFRTYKAEEIENLLKKGA